MEKLHEYSTSVTWTGKRSGRLEAPGLPALQVGAPPDFGGEGGVWSPEHLFVASAEVCALLTFVAIAAMSKLDFVAWSSRAEGKVEKVPEGGFAFSRIRIHVDVQVKYRSEVDKAERALRKTEQHCLVTKSMSTPVDLSYKVTVAEE